MLRCAVDYDVIVIGKGIFWVFLKLASFELDLIWVVDDMDLLARRMDEMQQPMWSMVVMVEW